jgi:hypothetical protein
LRDAQGLPIHAYESRPTGGGLPGPSRSARDSSNQSDPSSVAAHLVDSGIWGLQILPAGIQLENPSELFGSPGMQPVIDQLRLLADVVLVDTPPVLVVPDTAIIGSFTAGAVVVAAEGRRSATSLSGPCSAWRRPTAACSASLSTGCDVRRPARISPTRTNNDPGGEGRPSAPG